MRSAVSAATVAGRNILLMGKGHHKQYKNNHSSSQFLVQHFYHNCIHDVRQDDEKQINSNIHNESQLIKLNKSYQIRNYVSVTEPRAKSGATLVMGLGAVALTAKAGQYAVQAYEEWKESQPPPEETKDQSKSEDSSKMNSQDKHEDKANGDGKKAQENAKNEGKRENIFAKLFNMNVGSKYYEGGFDDKMTRKEAALILGVRESSTSKRIKDAHRKLLILNHPDTGGSTYLSGKVNEAKELLLKGR